MISSIELLSFHISIWERRNRRIFERIFTFWTPKVFPWLIIMRGAYLLIEYMKDRKNLLLLSCNFASFLRCSNGLSSFPKRTNEPSFSIQMQSEKSLLTFNPPPLPLSHPIWEKGIQLWIKKKPIQKSSKLISQDSPLICSIEERIRKIKISIKLELETREFFGF